MKEWRSPPFCRNFQSGTRSLHAHRYHCCSRLCTNQSKVCTVHTVKQQKIAHTYHYRKGACCTCSATTTPITPYCAQNAIPSLHIVQMKAKVHTDTNTKRKHTNINAKKAICACMLLLLYPEMCTRQCTNVCTGLKHKKHTMHYRCTNAALAVLPPIATTGSPSSNLCTIHNVQMCTEL